MTTSAIAVTGLRKSYGDHLVLDGIDFDVPAGTVFALLGQNGSGKTTTVEILTTLLRPDAGDVRVAGYDRATQRMSVRAAIGVTNQDSAIDTLLTGRENLRLIADLLHVPRRDVAGRVDELLRRLDLVDGADKPTATYSGGMKRRLDLAMTLLVEPQVLFLDEPTTGLDPRSRRQVWDEVRALVAAGVTVFLTTQYLEEADALADHIALLHGGKIVAAGTSAELKAMLPGTGVTLDDVFLALTEEVAS